MTQIIAWVFRSLNAHIITTKSEWVRKPLKVLLIFNRYFTRWLQNRLGDRPTWVTIGNFDHTIKLKIDRSRTMGASFYGSGFHEFREFIFLNKFLKDNMTVIDIGANLGEYTLFMAKRLTSGKVLAFEPIPILVDQLKENLSLNGFKNVVVLPVGLSDKDWMREVHEVDDPHEGLGTFYLGDRKSRMATRVALRTLDKEISSLDVHRLDFIKIDIEGSELPALMGSVNTIQKWKPYILVEINELTFKAAGYTSEKIKVFFDQLDYQSFQVNKKGELVQCVSLPKFGNVIFRPK